LKATEKELAKLKGAAVLSSAGDLASKAQDVNGTQVVAVAAPDGVSGSDLRTLVLDVRGRLDQARPGVVVLTSDVDGAAHFVVSVNKAGQDTGLSAGDLVKAFAPILGARGGGKADLAQGAGGDPSKVSEAFEVVVKTVATQN
jgi:alanyl-tRNA synthetase